MTWLGLALLSRVVRQAGSPLALWNGCLSLLEVHSYTALSVGLSVIYWYRGTWTFRGFI